MATGQKQCQTYSIIAEEKRWQQGAEKEKESRSEWLQCCTPEKNGLFLHFVKEKKPGQWWMNYSKLIKTSGMDSPINSEIWQVFFFHCRSTKMFQARFLKTQTDFTKDRLSFIMLPFFQRKTFAVELCCCTQVYFIHLWHSSIFISLLWRS